MSKIEIEYKYKLHNTKEVVKSLDEKAKLKYESHQIDTYYDSAATGYTRDLEKGRRIDLWLRVREEGDQASVNFKDWSISENDGFCTELESSIGEPGDVKGIFERMGFEPVAVVDKTRRAYKYKDVEISIDVVKELGDFIEIEYYGESDDTDMAQKMLKEILAEIDAKVEPDQDKRGYPYHMIERARKKN
jgi:adenylate cyclase class 2